MSVATKTKIALVANAEGVAAITGKLSTALPTDTSADPTVTRALDTATRINSTGNIETVVANKGRISYRLGTNKCPNLLVERSRTNLFPNSEDFTNTSWGKLGGATVTANQIIAPDGTLTADMITEGTSVLVYYTTLLPAGTYTQSYYAKKGTSDIFGMYFGGSFTASFNLTLGTIISQNNTVAQIENVGNGWFRCTATATIGADFFGGINVNSVDGSTFYVWGADIKTGSLLTSYIPTGAAAVTANADVITKTGISAIIPQTKGGLFFDGYLQAGSLSDNAQRSMCGLIGSAGNNVIFARTNNNLRIFVTTASSLVVNLSVVIPTPLLNKRIKVYLTLEANNFKCYLNGIESAVDTLGGYPNALQRLDIGYDSANGVYWDGLIKAVAVTDELDATEIDKLFQFSSYADMAAEMLYTTN
jgi:hypothetical protein